MQRSVNKYLKKHIHQGSAFSQGKRKNTYQFWKFMNIRCSGHINSAEFLNGCIGQDDNSSTVQIMLIIVRLVSIRPTLNQTRRCSVVRSYLFELINHFFELAREKQRERRMKVVCVNLRLCVSLYKQWGLVTSKTAQSLISVCNNVCVCASLKAA